MYLYWSTVGPLRAKAVLRRSGARMDSAVPCRGRREIPEQVGNDGKAGRGSGLTVIRGLTVIPGLTGDPGFPNWSGMTNWAGMTGRLDGDTIRVTTGHAT